MEFVEKNRLSCLTLKDEAYPSRLRECEDAPIVLFFKGNTDFNTADTLNTLLLNCMFASGHQRTHIQ